jgi:long-subunit acyl-CoA synthetase (AMP-forming)
MSQTVLGVLERTALAQPNAPAMRAKRSGSWHTTTWADYRSDVRRAARGLISLGVEPGRGVVIMGYNRPEWFIADVAAIAAGGLATGIYTTNTPEQCRYITDHAEAAVAVLENRDYLAKFLEVRDRLPGLLAIVVMEPFDARVDGVLSWAELLERGASVPEAELDARIAAQKPEDVCTLIYTSGTTGEPKGVMLTHSNVTFVGERFVELLKLGPADRMISYLPLSHIAEQVVTLHGPMACGACTAFAESLEKLADNLREVRPTLFFGVPRVWEKIQAGMQAAGAQAPPLRRKIVAWAKRVGLAGGYADQRGEARPWSYGLAQKLVFSKVRERLGLDAARYCVVSAAPTAVETLEFFLSLGIPILEVYGMSEVTGPSTMSLPGAYRSGSAGRAVSGTQMRLAEDGEILLRGPHVFKGYYKNEAATAETLDTEGWVHSGDIGEMSPDGYLRVTDRKKELIITSGGKNVAPQHIEGKLKQIPAVSQAVVIGDRRSYLVALLTLDPARVANEAAAAASPARTSEEAAACPLFRAYVEKQVEQVNAALARYESVRRFALLPQELSIANDELTATLKLKRRVIYKRYADQIEALYTAGRTEASS